MTDLTPGIEGGDGAPPDAGEETAGGCRYLTPEELLSFLPERSVIQLTNDDPHGTEPDMGRVREALLAAGELVDGYLRGRYELPLAEAPTLLRDVVRTIPASGSTSAVRRATCRKRSWKRTRPR